MNIRLEHWLFGSLHMQLRGQAVTDVIVDLQRKGVPLHHVRLGDETATLVVALRDFPGVYRICRARRVKIRFVERAGLPFTLRRVRRRKVFVAGAILFIVLVYAQSQIVWRVDIRGVSDETRIALRQAAAESGLYVGAWRGNLADVDQLQARIQKRLPSLTWVGVNMEGTIARIEAVEKVPGVETKNPQPCNVVAAKPATIRRVLATRGKAVVRPGQVVQPGQLLISGLIGHNKEVPASGEVWSEVWYTSQVTLPLKVQSDGLTGASVRRDYLLIGPWAVRVWGWEEPGYKASLPRDHDSDWHLGRFKLPLQLRTVTLYEADPQAVDQSVAEAERRALTLATQDVRRQMGKNGVVLEQKVLQRKVSHGKLYEKVFTRVEEDIGVAKPIPTAPPGVKASPKPR
jgi:similar to stage IV sporulation protein